MQDKIQQVASSASYAGSSAMAAWGALTAQDIIAIVGLCFMAATFVVNWIYKHKHFKLEEKKSD